MSMIAQCECSKSRPEPVADRVEYISQRVEILERRMNERGIGGNTLNYINQRERADSLEKEVLEAHEYIKVLQMRLQEIRKVTG